MRIRPLPPDPGRYLTVGAAAELLGVSGETLRRWDRAGKFKPLRHPINGYRLYDRGRLLALLSDLRPADIKKKGRCDPHRPDAEVSTDPGA